MAELDIMGEESRLEKGEEEMEVLVAKLKGQVSEKSNELETVRREIEALRDRISERSKERQNFMSNFNRIDEIAEQVSEHHQLRDKLQAKQEELRSLQNGSAHQLRELERVKEVVEELQKQQVELSALREKDQQTVEDLKSQHLQAKEIYSETRAKLENAKQQLSMCKENEERNRKPQSSSARKPLSVKLDQFITCSCKRAGLELST